MNEVLNKKILALINLSHKKNRQMSRLMEPSFHYQLNESFDNIFSNLTKISDEVYSSHAEENLQTLKVEINKEYIDQGDKIVLEITTKTKVGELVSEAKIYVTNEDNVYWFINKDQRKPINLDTMQEAIENKLAEQL